MSCGNSPSCHDVSAVVSHRRSNSLVAEAVRRYLRRTRHSRHAELDSNDIASAILKLDVRDDSDSNFLVHRFLKLPGLPGRPHRDYDPLFDDSDVVLVTAIPEQLKLLDELATQPAAPLVLYMDGTFKLTPFRNSVMICMLVADPVTNRTVPVCVGVAPTESEFACKLLLLETLKAPGAPQNLQIAAVVTDCTFAGHNAVQQIVDMAAAGNEGRGRNPVAHYWCWFHIHRAISDKLRQVFRGKNNAPTRNDVMRRMEVLHEATDESSFFAAESELRTFVNSLVDRRTPTNTEPRRLWEYLHDQWLKEGTERCVLCHCDGGA